MMAAKSPFVSPFGKRDMADKKKLEMAIGTSDHLTMWNAYNKVREWGMSVLDGPYRHSDLLTILYLHSSLTLHDNHFFFSYSFLCISSSCLS